MKKPKKSDSQLEREKADKEAETLRDCIAGLHKVGKASSFHFVCKIKAATGCDFQTAERHFEAAIASGEIREVGRNGAGDVRFFEAQKK